MSRHQRKHTHKSSEKLRNLFSEDRSQTDQQSPSFSKILKKDTTHLQAFIENMSSWLLVYLYSRSPKALAQLPKAPPLKYFLQLRGPCEELRETIIKIKESGKVKFLEDSIKELTEENSGLFKNLSECSFRMKQMSSREEEELNSMRREADLLKLEVRKACTDLHSTLEEAEKAGLAFTKTEGLNGYVSEVSKLVSSLLKPPGLTDSLVKVIYPLSNKCQTLQDKGAYFSRVFRGLYKVLNEEQRTIREMLNINEPKPRPKFKTYAIACVFMIKLQKVSKGKEWLLFQGVKISPLREKINLTFKTKSTPGIGTVNELCNMLQEKFGKGTILKHNWNPCISQHVKEFKVFMNDLKAIFKILLDENAELKKQNFTDNQTYKALENDYKKKLAYAKELEEQVSALAEEHIDPDEIEEILVELESHKKALKGLTNQYNVLEQEKIELQEKYDKLVSG